jgi:hypothetical protein
MAAIECPLCVEPLCFELTNTLSRASDLSVDGSKAVAGVRGHLDIGETGGAQPDETSLSLGKIGELGELLAKLEALGWAKGRVWDLKLADVGGRLLQATSHAVPAG